MYMNKQFWDLVKKLRQQNKSELKPCKFYETNKKFVEHEYKLLNSKPEKKPHLDVKK
jgi:hypothetical protein